MRRRASTLLLTPATAVAATSATLPRAAGYAGTFRGDIKGKPSAVELSVDGDGYAGTIRLGDAAMPCKATEGGGQLSGTFTSGGDAFAFTATLAGDTLTLRTGGATYALARRGNPLAAGVGGRGAAPAAASPGSVTATVLATTRTGRTLFPTLPSARTAAEALQATVPLLGSAVGGPVTVTGGFADGRAGTRGGASFAGTDGQGRAVRGTVLCGGGAEGEAVTLLYAAADAPAADWAALRAVLPRQPLRLTTYRCPDGTGTFGMPRGWTTKQTTLDAVLRSVRPDPAVMTQHYQAKLAQQQLNQQEHDAQVSQFDAMQEAHRQQQDGFDRANKGWEQRQLAGSRCNDDACEVIRGYRTVADTQLGTGTQVDLTSASAVADALNQQCGDPTRFVPIPLRDQLHPVNP